MIMHRSERAREVAAIPLAIATLAITQIPEAGLDRTAVETETETETETVYVGVLVAAAEAAGGPAAVATAVATTTAVSPTMLLLTAIGEVVVTATPATTAAHAAV